MYTKRKVTLEYESERLQSIELDVDRHLWQNRPARSIG